jgi:CelD/BcsL family acetyltransferase involved in cellulose biosynthesis
MCVSQTAQESAVFTESERDAITVQVFVSFADIAQMQQDWDSFMESVDAEIFLTFDWCRIWWKYYGKNRELALFVFKRGPDICAILPLFLEKIWLGPVAIRIVKLVGSDHMPVTMTVPIQRDCIRATVELLLNEMTGKWGWDLFCLGAICGRYSSTGELVNAFQTALGGSYHCEKKTKDVQTYFQVAGSWEQQVAGLGRKQRTNAKRTEREISGKGISVHSVLASEESLQVMFDKFVRMHQAHWQGIGKPGHFAAWPASAEFHLEVAKVQFQRNRLRLLEINFDDQTVGYEYLYRFGSTYFWFLNARAEPKYSPRIDYKWVAFREKTENALRDGVGCIDGMRGKYEYKLLMGGSPLSINNVYVYSSRRSVMARVVSFRLLVALLDICYSKLWRSRIAPRLGIRPKAFWKKWIRVHSLS